MPDYSKATESPLAEFPDADQYLVRGKAEIVSQLQKLAKRPEFVTAHFNNGKNYFLTAVLAVLKERDMLVLDFGPDESQSRRAIESGRLVCTARFQGVAIRFSCEKMQGARFRGQAAIATNIPETMYRLQRREFFRASTPKINGPRCIVPDPAGGESHELIITDLSAGGMGMIDTENRLQLETGVQLKNCRISLPEPENGDIETSLDIRSVTQLTPPSGPQTRYGVSFSDMSSPDNVLLQRYIFHLQAQQG